MGRYWRCLYLANEIISAITSTTTVSKVPLTDSISAADNEHGRELLADLLERHFLLPQYVQCHLQTLLLGGEVIARVAIPTHIEKNITIIVRLYLVL